MSSQPSRGRVIDREKEEERAQSRQSIRRISIKGTGSSLGEGTTVRRGRPCDLEQDVPVWCARALARRVRSSFVAGGPSPHRLARKVAFHFHVPFPVPSSARLRSDAAQRASTIRASARSARKRISWQVEGKRNRDSRLEKKTRQNNARSSRANDRVRKVSNVNTRSSMQV